MAKRTINKIIYFDKETIRNILQERDHGELSRKTDTSASVQLQGSVAAEASAKLKLEVPLLSRIAFLFTGKIESAYMISRDSTTTISSTEISEFEKLKPLLTSMSNIQLSDIENSSTSLRVAVAYMKIVKEGVEQVDAKELKAVIDNFDGYDTYAVDKKRYVRFNNAAFVSNYKRNDLLNTTMTVYCVPVGEFEKKRFDFLEEMGKMERLVTSAGHQKTLADIYPPKENNEADSAMEYSPAIPKETVTLYDALYACVTAEAPSEK